MAEKLKNTINYYNQILENIDNYSEKELSSNWSDLSKFLESIKKSDLDIKIKELLFEIIKKCTGKSNILPIVVYEFILPKLDWFSKKELEKLSKNLGDLILNLNCEDMDFSILIDALNSARLNKLPNLIEILNLILDKVEEKTNDKNFSNNTLLFMLLDKFTVKNQEITKIRFKIDFSSEEKKNFINRLTELTQKISAKINSEMNWHRQDLNETSKPIREIISQISKSKDSSLTQKIITSLTNQIFGTKEQLQKISSNCIFHIFPMINTDNRGITNTVNENEEKVYSMFLSLQAGTVVLLNEIIVSKLTEDEFKTLFENINQVLFNNEYLKGKYANLELISIMYFREYNSILNLISNSKNLTEDEKINLVYRCNSFLDSISLKFEAIIRIIKSLLDKNHEIVFDTKNGEYKYKTSINKILEDIIGNENIANIGITGFLEYLSHFLYNEKNGWRNYFGHSFKLNHFSSDNLQLIMTIWSLYVGSLALLNSFERTA